MSRSTSALWLRWVGAFTLGEVLGFGCLPAALGLGVMTLTKELPATPRGLLLYAVAIVGGLGEGAVVGAFQRRVLREVLPSLDGRAWVRHTAFAAAGAWAVGMCAPTLDELFTLPPAVMVALWVPAAVLILLSIGGVQARLLRGVVARPARWLWINVAGWLAGLPWTFIAPAVLPDDSPAWRFGVAFLLGGTLMGATTGAITGVLVVRLARAR